VEPISFRTAPGRERGSRGRQPHHTARPTVVSSARFARQVDATLAPILAADDRLIAGASVVSGVPPFPMLVFGGPIAGLIAGVTYAVARSLWPGHALEPSLWMVALLAAPSAALPSWITFWLQRPTYIALSRQQLICARLTAFRQRPVRVRTVPLSAARIDGCRWGSKTTSVTVTLPGARPLRLHGFGRQRRPALDQVLTWAATAGVTVASKPGGKRDQTSALAADPWASSLPQWSRWPDG
jgi:hypothetical protein